MAKRTPFSPNPATPQEDDAPTGPVLFNPDDHEDLEPYGVFEMKCIAVKTAKDGAQLILDFQIVEDPFTQADTLGIIVTHAEKRQRKRLTQACAILGLDISKGSGNQLTLNDPRVVGKYCRGVIGQYNDSPSLAWGGKNLKSFVPYLDWIKEDPESRGKYSPDQAIIKNTCGILPQE